MYCYVCDDGKTDPELARHLHTFGINVATQTKTEKSVTELVSNVLCPNSSAKMTCICSLSKLSIISITTSA